MAEKKGRDVVRLARLALDIEHKRVLLMDFQRRLDAVERTGIAVVGERWLLGRVQGWQQQALDAFTRLQASDSPAAQLDEIERLLSDPDWPLAEQSRNDLAKKDDEQQQQLRDFQPRLAQWQTQISSLRQELAGALKTRAPVNRERALFLKLEAIVARAGRELDEQKLGQLTLSLDELEREQNALQQMFADIKHKVEVSERIVRQADLLLLRSPRIRRCYEFTVLLRTPSSPGSHGVNIQDSSTLVEQDHKRMRSAVKNIGDMINKGLARQFTARNAPATAPAAAPLAPAAAGPTPVTAAVRNLIPVAASGAPILTQSANDVAQSTGDLIYHLIMPDQMQQYLMETPCSLTMTTNDLELPWELMWDDQSEHKFLCLDRAVARMPMGRAFPRRETSYRTPSPKLRFLLIYADPTGNLPAAKAEVDQIEARLNEEWKNKLDLEVTVLRGAEANGEKITEVLRSGAYDVIHYAGHAVFDEKDADLSGLWLHGREILFAQKIRRLLEGRPLVFLNACESGRTANEQRPQAVGRYLQRPAEGLASAFIYGGALGCIGSLWPVYDDAAADFAIAFYNRVLEGNMLGEAMRQARLHIRDKYPSQITWAGFILYGDPTLQLDD